MIPIVAETREPRSQIYKKLFARKFGTDIDTHILDRIDLELRT